MTRAGIAVVLGALASACTIEDAPAPTTDQPTAQPAGGPETTAEGDQAPANSREAPCGASTVATVQTGADSSVVFCVEPNGVESIGEIAPLGTPSKLRATGIDYKQACAADVFRAIAPDRAVPQRLLDSCAANPVAARPRPITPEAIPVEETTAALSYCNASGAANFQAEQCSQISCNADTLCSRYCIADAWGWHDRALTWQLAGEEGNWGEERVASCGGSTRFRGFWRDDVGDAWITSIDTTILSGQWVHYYIHYYAPFADGDIRFRSDSSSGASHRHTGVFMDW